MAKKSIFYIITKSVWGGAAKYVYDLAINLPKDFQATVAAGPEDKKKQGKDSQGELTRRLKDSQIKFLPIKNFQRKINFFKEFLAFFELLKLIFQEKPDVIHANSSKAGGLAGLAGFIFKIFHPQTKLVFTAHGWAFNEERPDKQKRAIQFLSYLTCLFYDKIICVSKYDLKKALEKKIAPARKLEAIHNGLDLERMSFLEKKEAQEKLINKTSPLLIGTIAEWTQNKNIFSLLEATKENKQGFDLVLIGSGENPLKKEIHRFIEKNKIKNVYLHDFIPQASQYLKAFDLFVLPSFKEGLPYTVLEAMAAKTPVLASAIGGIPEIIKDNQNGFLLYEKTSSEIAGKINEFIQLEKEKIEEIQRLSRQEIEKNFSLKQMVKKTTSLYLS